MKGSQAMNQFGDKLQKTKTQYLGSNASG